MRRARVIVFSCLAALTSAIAAQALATSYLDQAAKALKSSPVYVASGTPGTNTDTAGVLALQLTEKDNTFIIMLPAEALVETQGNINLFVRKIDQATGHDRIIGLAVGDQSVGYSTKLPPGTAADLMQRAFDVSTNPVETLSTFITNVHDWQTQHPQPVAPKPKPKPSKKDSGFPWWTLSFITVVGIAVWILIRVRQQSVLSQPIHLKASPESVRVIIGRINQRRHELRDTAPSEKILQICRHTEDYFARATSARDRDATVFHGHLKSLYDVLDKYIDIERNPLYYDDPNGLLEIGREAFENFDAYVLASIRRGSRQALTEFNVNTDILSAQRYKNS